MLHFIFVFEYTRTHTKRDRKREYTFPASETGFYYLMVFVETNRKENGAIMLVNAL